MRATRHTILFLILLCFSGCSKRQIAPDSSTPAGEQQYTLSIRIPDLETETRSFTPATEGEITWLTVMAFRKETDGTETFAYLRSASAINNNDASEKNFRVSLKKSSSTEQYRFVMLANLKDAVEAVQDQFTEGMEKQDVLDMILFDSPAQWNTTTPVSLPMWGETAETHLITSSTLGTSLGTVKMLYSVARIDVGLSINSGLTAFQGNADFELTKVRVYNTNSKGHAAPSEDATAEFYLYNAVQNPSIPNPVTLNTPVAEYAVPSTDHGLLRTIYTSEYDNKSLTAAEDNRLLCLLVAGKYKGGSEKWYRIDLYDRSASGTPFENRIDILRNHRYLVNITSVDGEGETDPDEALKGRAIRMQAEVIPWDRYWSKPQLGDYTLEVSQVDFLLSYEPRTQTELAAFTDNIFTVNTDHPDGFTLRLTDGAGNPIAAGDEWFSVYPSDPAEWVDGQQIHILTEGHISPDGEPRRGRIYLTVADIEYVIFVGQEAAIGDCGFDGIPLYQKIGTRHYPTHVYQLADGSKICMMTENLREILKPAWDSDDYILKSHNEATEDWGYYYSGLQTTINQVDFCPAGWRTMQERDFLHLQQYWNEHDGFNTDDYPTIESLPYQARSLWEQNAGYIEIFIYTGDPTHNLYSYASPGLTCFTMLYEGSDPVMSISLNVIHIFRNQGTFNSVTMSSNNPAANLIYAPIRCVRDDN